MASEEVCAAHGTPSLVRKSCVITVGQPPTRLASLSLLVVLVGCRETATITPPILPVSTEVAILAELTDPAKLNTLRGKRAATPRLRKACYWIEVARRGG